VKAVRCGQLWTGVGEQALEDALVVADDQGLISAVLTWNADAVQEGDLLDWSGLTVIPGLIDCHDHLGLDLGDEAEQAREPDTWTALKAARNARTAIAAGITTLRDAGEKNYVDVLFKKAIIQGVIPGPRLLICGRVITRTGGHCHYLARQADGPDDLRRAVREQVREGADFVKAMLTGGLSTEGSDPMEPAYTPHETTVLIEEAHRLGRRVAAHAHGGSGARDAIAAGLDSLEHGAYLTADDLRFMADQGTSLVTTYGVMRVGAEAGNGTVPGFMRDKLRGALDAYLDTLRKARRAGVRMAVGTDCVHGRLDLELCALVESGFSSTDALRAATIGGAHVCGLEDYVGTIEVGKSADLVAFTTSPLEDVGNITSVASVMKGGKIQTV
jgi:imidazolonepropionase-like amidohydrolase